MHALHNAIFVSVALLSFEFFPEEKINIENEDFTLSIEEVFFENNSLIKYNKADTIQFEATSLKTILSTINQVDEDVIDASNSKALNQKLTILLIDKSKQKINQDSLLLIHLKEMYNFDIQQQKREQLVYQLYIQDASLVNKHLSEEEEEASTTIVTSKEIEFKSPSNSKCFK